MKKIALLLVALLGVSLVLTACGASERDRFVNASVDVGCAIFDEPDLFSDRVALETKTLEVFAGYGFDVTDEVALDSLSEKYQYEEDVIKDVQDGITMCAAEMIGEAMVDSE